MNIEQLLNHYGYLAIFIGSILEGETILTLAGFFVHRGYLLFVPSILCATAGGMLGDQVCFLLGRYYGTRLLQHFPKLDPLVEKTNRLLCKHSSIIIIGVRFMYGLRIAGPIAIGMSKVSFPRFLLLNALGALFWAIIIVSFGYLFGQSAQWMFAQFHQYTKLLFAIILLVAVIVLSIYWYSKQRRNR
ncbi:DedA family protein [Snodgrassella gandavensis]|uniref:DedA family protein n=1 Tax=Snodgrassella gandavensis TaxID=2946698 RepID=UPI001EF603C7|nr:DedA family protein [Snodgrassella gandavensis]